MPPSGSISASAASTLADIATAAMMAWIRMCRFKCTSAASALMRVKRRDRPYQAGRSKHWVKVKNRRHPAMSRVMEAFG
jgi:hypothetical protein